MHRIFLTLLCLPFFTQVFGIEICRDVQFSISGTLYSTSDYQGGAYRGNYQPPQIPLINFTMYVVRWVDEKTIPTVVTSFTSDEKGNFQVSLAPGKYGFVTATEKDSLSKGQWFPKNVFGGDIAEMHSSWWEFSVAEPIDLRTGSVAGITLTNHKKTTCGLCP